MLVEKKPPKVIFETHLPLPLLARGKVRDIYAVDDDKLLIVTTDRLSAFDVVLPNPIPERGKVLNQISAFWFEKFKPIIANHLITLDIYKMGLSSALLNEYAEDIMGRAVLVYRTKPLAVECVIRGYLAGSGWKDYQNTHMICGQPLPAGLKQCEKLPQPLFTPATKAAVGHDENIDFNAVVELVGTDLAKQLETVSLKLYQAGALFALSKGIIIADTKFEFGLWKNELILIDEVLTPDSSRFWPQNQYAAGRDQPSFDKQIVRNYLLSTNWNKQPPAPDLPQQIIHETSQAYQDVYCRLTGEAV